MTDKPLSPGNFPQDAWEWIVVLGGPSADTATLPWEKAWAMAVRACQLQSPYRHLLRYLSSCSHRSLAPSSVTWIRFLMDDEQREAREIEVEVAMRTREAENEQSRRAEEPPSKTAWRDQWVQ